ncbi:MAG TPA: DNA polymerase Y family protein [Acidobacteriaceae bacterium]|nr:DNA polymerase Y family protein [Acidobacteriaceae bacterium]
MSHPAELYACVYVREFPAQALLRLRPELHDKPCVVLDGEPPVQTVCSLNTRARLLGLRQRMTKVEVETFESVIILHRSSKTEAAVRAILLECAGAFSPRIEDRTQDGIFLCAVDAAGTEALFGPPHQLAKKLRQRVRSVGIVASVTLSTNLHTAICLARGLRTDVTIYVVPRGEEAKSLAPLPVAVLEMTDTQAEIFRLWGIRTVAALAALPEKALIARLGQDAKRLLELARGVRAHLFQPIDVPFVLEEIVELDSPLNDLESLLFGLSAMLEQLIIRAKSRVLALATVTLKLHLHGGGSHKRKVSPRVPTNEKQLWLKLLHLDLESNAPSSSILGVHICAEPGAKSRVQLGLFSPKLPEPGRLEITLARIAAIVGEGNVGQAVLHDTHRTNDFHVEVFTITSKEPREPGTGSPLCLRMLRPPEPSKVEIRRGVPSQIHFRSRAYHVEQAYGPWLSGGDWWNEAIWGNEQWDVIGKATDSAMLVCRLARDFVQNDWRVAALYD